MSVPRADRLLAYALSGLLGAVPLSDAAAALLGHGGPVRGIAVSRDGEIAVTAGFDYSVIVWRLANESVVHRLLGHDGPVNAVALTPDGGAAVSAGDDGSIAVWDLGTGELRRRLRADAKLGAIAVSPDGGEVAAGGWDGQVHRWRLGDGAPLPLLDNGGERVTAVAYDEERLLAGGHEGSLRVWRRADGAQERQVPAHDFALTGLAVLAHGGTLTASIDRTLRRWSDEGMLELAGHEQPIVALAASPDGTLAASAGAKGEVMLWNGAEGHPTLVLAGSGPTAWALALTPDGHRLLAGGADGAVRVWSTATGQLLGRPVPEAEAPAAGRGPQLFLKCAVCHTLTADGGNKAGPPLGGLFGRLAGSVADYPYSDALRTSGIVWTEETVARLFDLGPEHVVPGSKMPLQRLADPRDRSDLIDYLEHMSGG